MTKADDQKWVADKSLTVMGTLLGIIIALVAYINTVQNSAVMDALLEMKSDYKIMRSDLAQVKVQTAPFAIRLTTVEKVVETLTAHCASLEKKITEHILIDNARYKNIGDE
jgi:hypothetical protein